MAMHSDIGVAYPVQLDPEPEGGFTVSFPDFNTGYSYGTTREEALRQAADLLETVVANCMAEEWPIPAPSPAQGRPLVFLEPLVTAKVELYREMQAAGLSKAELARRLRAAPKKVEQLFDTSHRSRIDELAAAFGVLGRRLVITSEADASSGS